jgi:peptide chain release factor 2
MPEFNDDGSIEIREDELEITTHKSSGAGGQHVNKTESAIRIVHIPTGIVVGCQTERSQLQNKETALKMLKSKLMEIKQREKLEKIEDIQGVKSNIEWGAQIRSYVFMPYTLAKDTRTGFENGNIQGVMDGDIDGFINAYLKMNAK